MHILFVDTHNFQTQTRRALIEDEIANMTKNDEEASYSTDVVESLGELHLKYKKGEYDLVILDHTIETGEECFEHIISEDPMQNILVVSNAVKCVVRRCADCVEHHSIRRLNNPTPIPNIMRMVKGFDLYDCDWYDSETDKLAPEA
jgi:hypothetical protein